MAAAGAGVGDGGEGAAAAGAAAGEGGSGVEGATTAPPAEGEEGEGAAAAAADGAAGEGGEGGAPKAKKERPPRAPRAPIVRFKHVVFETSILEPEAAVYLVARSAGRFSVHAPGAHAAPEVLAAEAAWAEAAEAGRAAAHAAGHTDPTAIAMFIPPPPPPPLPLTVEQLWTHFCARVRNFPARYAVYAHCRDRCVGR
jgi:hypothetical protein